MEVMEVEKQNDMVLDELALKLENELINNEAAFERIKDKLGIKKVTELEGKIREVVIPKIIQRDSATRMCKELAEKLG